MRIRAAEKLVIAELKGVGNCKNISIKCFLPTSVNKTNALSLLLSDPKPLLQNADYVLKIVCRFS